MARHDELPVYKATCDLMVSVFRFVKDFTKEYKQRLNGLERNKL